MGKPWKIIETHEYVKAVVQSLLFHFCWGTKTDIAKNKNIQFSQSKHAPAFCIVPSLHEETHLGWS
jgi:hypothetical protein